MKIKWSVCMPKLHGTTEEGVLEMADDATDEEIQAAVDDEITNYVSWGWEKVEN